MSANTSLAIRIAAIFDNKGLKQAGKEVSKLQGAVKKLAGAAGISLSTAAVINFGKNAVKAFAENEKSAKRLAGVVKNLGQAFETPLIEQNLDQISAKFGYQGEVLREAYQKLLTATGSVTKSNELLNASLDIAAGSGQDLVSVNQDLAALYQGNTKGLKKYNLGLSQSELKTLDFEKGLALLSKTFKGAAGEELTTYSGKMRVLGEAAGNAQEIIGKGLVESLSILAGEGNTVQPIADSMQDLATYISDVITGLATMIAEFKKLPGVQKYVTEVFPAYLRNTPAGALLELVKGFAPKTTPGMGGYPSSALGPGYVDPNQAKRDAIEKERLKREKERLALEKKGQAEAKKRAALEKAAKTLNLEAIGIEAALKGKISETDRISLLLQKAILDGNASLATKLAEQLDAATKRQSELRQMLVTTPEAPNPYRNWVIPADVLSWTAASLGVSVSSLGTTPVAPSSTFSDAQMELMSAVNSYQRADQQAINIQVYLDGNAVTGAITETQVNQSLSGTFSDVNRVASRGAVAIR